jgi:hypothetical protein
MTGISLQQWPPTSQSHGSVSKREQLIFSLRIKLHAQFLSLVFKSTVPHLTLNPVVLTNTQIPYLNSDHGQPKGMEFDM